jgi:malonyl-CoA/methylmalonyl-CoA synthetase
MVSNSLQKLWHHLRARPEATAFTFEGRPLTFGAWEDRARRYAAGLERRGLTAGDRVVCALESSEALVVALLGHYLLGVVHVPVNPRYGRAELSHILADSGAAAALVDAGGPAEAELDELAWGGLQVAVGGDGARGFAALCDGAPTDKAPPGQDEDAAMILYTSGTTGRSKGAVLPYRALVSNIDALTRQWRWEPSDHLVLALPLFHVHGLGIGVHGVLLRGCAAQVHARFDAHAVCAAMAAGGTIFMGVPTMYSRLVAAMDEAPALAEGMRGARLYTAGSAALSAELFARFEAHTGHRILERYGMSETMLTVSNPYAPARRKPGTIGLPVDGVEVEIQRDDGARCAPGELGEIAVRGPSLMTGYWGDPARTASSHRGGWFMTGDAARYDDEGYLVHVGRLSADILKTGGFRVSAREIEEAIALHPEVAEVAVIGLPDADWGQRVAAALVPAPSASPRDADAWAQLLREHLAPLLADYKRPRAVIALPALPRNALGKLQKHLLAPCFEPHT